MSKFLSLLISLKTFLRRAGTSGNAVVISVIVVSVTTLAVVGVSSLVLDSSRKSDLSQKANEAFFAADAQFETGMYDMAGHAAGHQVGDREGNTYNLRTFRKGRGQAKWQVIDRTLFLNTSAEAEVDGYDGSNYPEEFDGYLVYPRPRHGNTAADANWNTLVPGTDESVPLFVDNTSCDQPGGNCS